MRFALAIFAAGLMFGGQALAQCEFIPFDEAQRVLGSDTTDLSGDDASTQCFFLSNSTNDMFIIQISDREYFENVTLQQPFEIVDIGEKGRSRTEDNGTAAVQFVQGDVSVTMSVRPTSPSTTDYLAILLEVAARAAARL
jgi:hypothetical protein